MTLVPTRKEIPVHVSLMPSSNSHSPNATPPDDGNTSTLQELLNYLAASLQNKIGTRNSSLRNVMLYQGILVSKEESIKPKSVYKFELPDDVKLSTDDDVKFHLQGTRIEAEIVSVDSQFVSIKCSGSHGDKIDELKLSIDSVAIPKKLLERINAIKSAVISNGTKYQLTKDLIGPKANEITCSWHKELLLDGDYNDRQKKALEISLRSKISFIWGPPGTGKTKTLGAIALNLIKGGKRILFASNTNRAVDNGVIAVIKQLQNRNIDYRKEITRYGQTALSYSNELISVQFANQISDLRKEEEQKKQKLTKLLEQHDLVLKKIGQLDDLESKHSHLKSRKNTINEEHKNVLKSISIINNQLDEIKNGGIKISLKLTFGILSEEKMKRDKQILQQKGRNQKEEIATIQQEIETIENDLAPLKEREGRFREIISEVETEGGRKQIEEKIHSESKIDEKDVLQKKSFVGSTLAKIAMNNVFWGIQYDVLLIDEASMVDLAYLTALSTLVKEKIIIVGDPQQLAPIADQDDILRKDIFIFASGVNNVSELFEWNEKNPSFTVFLDTQYRMTAKLGDIVSRIIYNGRLKNDISVNSIKGKVVLIDTTSLQPKTEKVPDPQKFLAFNPIHCKQIITSVKDALANGRIAASEIGVIVPFTYSVQYVREQFKRNNLRNIEIGNVYTFQGREKKVIIFDTVMAGVNFTVRSFDETRVGIEEVRRLLNVAISRSTCDLYVIACMQYFENYHQNQLVLRVLKEIDAASLSVDESETFDEAKINVDYEKLSIEEIDKLLNE